MSNAVDITTVSFTLSTIVLNNDLMSTHFFGSVLFFLTVQCITKYRMTKVSILMFPTINIPDSNFQVSRIGFLF